MTEVQVGDPVWVFDCRVLHADKMPDAVPVMRGRITRVGRKLADIAWECLTGDTAGTFRMADQTIHDYSGLVHYLTVAQVAQCRTRQAAMPLLAQARLPQTSAWAGKLVNLIDS